MQETSNGGNMKGFSAVVERQPSLLVPLGKPWLSTLLQESQSLGSGAGGAGLEQELVLISEALMCLA